jgi:hypothetical protein
MADYVLHAEPGHINMTGAAFMTCGNRYREAAELWMQRSDIDLRKLPSFLQKHAKKQPSYSGTFWRRYVALEIGV